MKWGAVLTGLWPHAITSLLWLTSAYGWLQRLPSVASTARSAAAPQMLRCNWLAPSRFQKRALETVFQLENSELAVEPLPDSNNRHLLLFYEAAAGQGCCAA